MELKEDVASADVPHDGLTIRSSTDSIEYRGGLGLWPRLDCSENLGKDVLRILKIVEFSLELTIFVTQSCNSPF